MKKKEKPKERYDRILRTMTKNHKEAKGRIILLSSEEYKDYVSLFPSKNYPHVGFHNYEYNGKVVLEDTEIK